MAKSRKSKGVQPGRPARSAPEHAGAAKSGVTLEAPVKRLEGAGESAAAPDENEPSSGRGFRVAMWIWTIGFLMMILFEVASVIFS